MLIFFPILTVALLFWIILLDIQERQTKAKLDGLEKIVERIEEKTKKQD